MIETIFAVFRLLLSDPTTCAKIQLDAIFNPEASFLKEPSGSEFLRLFAANVVLLPLIFLSSDTLA